MELKRTHYYLLRVFYQRLARYGLVRLRDIPTAFCGAPADVSRALAELGTWGLIDPARLRLTLAGLAVAVATGARSGVLARRIKPDTMHLRRIDRPRSTAGYRGACGANLLPV